MTAKNSKTARRRLVKILPNLHAWLTPFRKIPGLVIPANLRWLLVDAREKAGISEWPSNALPRLDRDLTSRLYHQAQAERVPMTALASRFVRDGLADGKALIVRTKTHLYRIEK